MKIIGILILIFVSIFIIVSYANRSKETIFTCEGIFEKKDIKQDLTIYLKLEKYHPIVSLWSDSKGILTVELPNIWIEAFTHLEEVGNQVHIYDKRYSREDKNKKLLVGNLSTISGVLSLATYGGFFDGKCTN